MMKAFEKYMNQFQRDALSEHEKFRVALENVLCPQTLDAQIGTTCEQYKSALLMQIELDKVIDLVLQFKFHFSKLVQHLQTPTSQPLLTISDIIQCAKGLATQIQSQNSNQWHLAGTLSHEDVLVVENRTKNMQQLSSLLANFLRIRDELSRYGCSVKSDQDATKTIEMLQKDHKDAKEFFFAHNQLATYLYVCTSQSYNLCDYQKVDLNQRLLIADRKSQVDRSAELCNTIDRVKSHTPGNDSSLYVDKYGSCLFVDKHVDYDDYGNEIRIWYSLDQVLSFSSFIFTTSSDRVLPDYVKEAVKRFAFACRPPTRDVLKWIWSHATLDDPWMDIIQRKKGLSMISEIEKVVTPVDTIFLDANAHKCRMDENLMRLAYETAISRAIFLSRLS